MNEYLVGVRLARAGAATLQAVGDLVLHVGDVVSVETQSGTALGEVRRPRRPVPEFRRDRSTARGRSGLRGGGPRVSRAAAREEAAIVTAASSPAGAGWR